MPDHPTSTKPRAIEGMSREELRTLLRAAADSGEPILIDLRIPLTPRKRKQKKTIPNGGNHQQ